MTSRVREPLSSGWRLTRAKSDDMDGLMTWFRNAGEVNVWGGPRFRFPYTAETFRTDCHWPEMDSYFLCDANRVLHAFGQFYDRNGYMNLARLVVAREHRGWGLGRELVTRLMQAAGEQSELESFSLFVYRDNTPALKLYQSLGFEIKEYPPDEMLADECFFLTRAR